MVEATSRAACDFPEAVAPTNATGAAGGEGGGRAASGTSRGMTAPDAGSGARTDRAAQPADTGMRTRCTGRAVTVRSDPVR